MRVHYFFKRLVDAVLSALALLLLSPLFLVLSLAVLIDSGRPVLFRQQRLGKNGVPFTMYKFRSMVVNAESTGAGLFNYAGDPRVTRVGRFLRNTSLDELPQLWNVLTGKLSLVGPRPPVTYELGDFATLNRKYRRRFEVKPGITGLAQVQGRNEIPWDKKVEFDNEYIERFRREGIWLDIKILFKTVFNVLGSKDICELKPDDMLDDAEAAALAEQEVIRLAHEPDEPAVIG